MKERDGTCGELLCEGMRPETWSRYISLSDSDRERVNSLIETLLNQQSGGQQ